MAVAEIEQVLYSLLTGDETVTGLVGTRIYPNVVPQGAAMPALTYQQISGAREHTFDGVFGLANPRFQINCWAAQYSGARQLANAVRALLDCYVGTVSERVIVTIFLLDEGDMPEITPGVDTLRRFGKHLDFSVWFEE